MFHELEHVLLLHGVHPELLQLLAATTEQLLARVEVLLDRVDAFAGCGDMAGHGAEEVHDLGEVAIVLRHELVEDLVGLLELALDLLLLLLALLVRFAGVQGLDDGHQKAATSLRGRSRIVGLVHGQWVSLDMHGVVGCGNNWVLHST